MIYLPSDSIGVSYGALTVHQIVDGGSESTSHVNLKDVFLATTDGPDICGVLGGSI